MLYSSCAAHNDDISHYDCTHRCSLLPYQLHTKSKKIGQPWRYRKKKHRSDTHICIFEENLVARKSWISIICNARRRMAHEVFTLCSFLSFFSLSMYKMVFYQAYISHVDYYYYLLLLVDYCCFLFSFRFSGQLEFGKDISSLMLDAAQAS